MLDFFLLTFHTVATTGAGSLVETRVGNLRGKASSVETRAWSEICFLEAESLLLPQGEGLSL